MSSLVLAVMYYRGTDGDQRWTLVKTDEEPHYVDPESIGLTTDDNINAVVVMHDGCTHLACLSGNKTDNGAAVMYDVSLDEQVRQESGEAGYDLVELEDFTNVSVNGEG